MEAAQRLRKAHCDKLLKLYRKSHEKDGLKIVHVIGDGYCAYNCFSLALHLSDGSAEKLQADFIEWLWTDPFPAQDILNYIDNVTGRSERLRTMGESATAPAIDHYRDAAVASAELEIHLVLLLAYQLDVPLALVAPVQDPYRQMFDPNHGYKSVEYGFWFMDAQTPERPPLYMSFEPLTDTCNNSLHYNLMVPTSHTFRHQMRVVPFADRIRAGRQQCQELFAARLAHSAPLTLALAPAPAPAVPVPMPVAEVLCALGPPPQASAPVKKKRPPRKHNPDAHKRWLDKLPDGFTVVRLPLMLGDAVWFDGTVLHAGSSYENPHVRIHMYVMHPEFARQAAQPGQHEELNPGTAVTFPRQVLNTCLYIRPS